MPVLIGTAWAAAVHRRFDMPMFLLALACTLLAHAAANVFNDVGDDLIGADDGNTGRIYPFTGGSRFIQAGLLSRTRMLQLALGLSSAALMLGALLAALRGPGVIVLGLAGLSLGLLYSLPGAQLSARGLGESAVALAFGALPLLGCVWLQTGRLDAGSVLLSVPVGAWAAAILLINEVPDAEADRRAGKNTLVVRLGVGSARRLYHALTGAALAAGAAAVVLKVLPTGYAIGALALAGLGAYAGVGIQMHDRGRLKRSIEITLAIHAAGGAALLLAIALRRA